MQSRLKGVCKSNSYVCFVSWYSRYHPARLVRVTVRRGVSRRCIPVHMHRPTVAAPLVRAHAEMHRSALHSLHRPTTQHVEIGRRAPLCQPVIPHILSTINPLLSFPPFLQVSVTRNPRFVAGSCESVFFFHLEVMFAPVWRLLYRR